MGWRRLRAWGLVACVALLCVLAELAVAAGGRISGMVVDPKGAPVANANLKLLNAAATVVKTAKSDEQGRFEMDGIEAGAYQLTAEAEAFVKVIADVAIGVGETREVRLQFRQVVALRQAITVVAGQPSSMTPDPAESVIVHDQVLDANPGRPGAPISIPGLPIETASGGIKAPQYFAPGVAGDHGEPIAQYFQVGSYLYPNNLPANAHGNGYADPNVLIPITIADVTVDGGAFNVREGNHSVDLAARYGSRERFNDFVQVTGDYRDIDVMAGWSPANAGTKGWIAGEAAYGNGFLERLEHRQQYKLNGYRQFELGRNELTLYGIGYYGFSYVPGLIPIEGNVPGDTIDNRQLDRTSNFLAAASDDWKLDERRQFTFAGFFRDYNLRLRSNFGDGLIQQSETRTVVGGEAAYVQSVRPWLALLAGVDLQWDAPRNLDLKRANAEGAFEPVTSNNLTMSFVEPFASLDGNLGEYVHYNAGMRQEEVRMHNQDLLDPGNSFDKLATLTLPKATMTLFPAQNGYLPMVAFSYGYAFHANDPRIGTGSAEPTLLSESRAMQLRIAKNVKEFEVSVTLRRTANSQELAKIDPDTGLQVDQGPSLNRAITVAVQRTFTRGAFYVSYAQADARDRSTREPVPEAPRMIWDAVASLSRLPWRLQARGEFEFVKAKPLGDGFVGVPVYEVRGAVLRPFLANRMSLGLNFLAASGYTGQTTETIAGGPGNCAMECIVGVPLKSYVSASWTYYWKK
jgi:carboxypeptidase family protein